MSHDADYYAYSATLYMRRQRRMLASASFAWPSEATFMALAPVATLAFLSLIFQAYMDVKFKRLERKIDRSASDVKFDQLQLDSEERFDMLRSDSDLRSATLKSDFDLRMFLLLLLQAIVFAAVFAVV
jgi:hypothetical protein